MENMSNTTNLNVRVDGSIKKAADILFKDLGLNMTTAINMFLTQCVKTEGIPFNISEPKPSKQLKKALKETDYMTKYPEQYKGYYDVHEMFEDILSED